MAAETQLLTQTEKAILKAAAVKKGRTAVEIATKLGYEKPQALNRTIGVLLQRDLLRLTSLKPNHYTSTPD